MVDLAPFIKRVYFVYDLYEGFFYLLYPLCLLLESICHLTLICLVPYSSHHILDVHIVPKFDKFLVPELNQFHYTLLDRVYF